MAKVKGKRYREALGLFDRSARYGLEDAVGIIKKMARLKFDETVELVFKLGVDPRHADQQVRGSVVLPHGLGKSVCVLVFAKGEQAQVAKEAGADFVGADDLTEKITGGWTGFDVAIASPEMMSSVGRLGRILGPRGLMPNPKSGTVTPDVLRAVQEAKAGRVEFRVDRLGIINTPVGKVSFESNRLVENGQMIVDSVVRAKPASTKGLYIRSKTLSTTMGPGIRLE